MKSTQKTISRTFSANFRHVVILAVLLCSINIAAKAQYYTKITVDPLVEIPKVTYSASWADYNNDGYQDLLLNGSVLFRNDAGHGFTNVADSVGLTDAKGRGGLFADFNNVFDYSPSSYIINNRNILTFDKNGMRVNVGVSGRF